MTKAKSLARGEGRADLPRRDRAPGAATCASAHDARDAAAADEQLRHARRHARGARALPRAGARRACRSTSCRARCRSCWRTTTSSRSSWAADPALEWAPPGHGDVFTSLATSGMLDDAARARLRVPVPVELGQPRRGARPAHPRLVRERGAAVPVGGRGPHRVRPQGRPPGAPARRTAGWCCARPPRCRTRTRRRSRTWSATASSTRTTSG